MKEQWTINARKHVELIRPHLAAAKPGKTMIWGDVAIMNNGEGLFVFTRADCPGLPDELKEHAEASFADYKAKHPDYEPLEEQENTAVCPHKHIRKKTARSINLRYWYCSECGAIVRFTIVTCKIGQCHAEAGRLVTLDFRLDRVWKQILATFYPNQTAVVGQGLMNGTVEHSWVEIGDHAFDTNYGAIFDSKEYYRVYSITNIERYTASQFTEQQVRHDEYCYFGTHP